MEPEGAWPEVRAPERVDERAERVEPAADGELELCDGGTSIGAFAAAHEQDEALTAHVLLENLAIKASAVHALRHLLATSGIDPASITLNGQTIDPASTYRIVTNSFLADGGDSFTAFTEGTNRKGGGDDLAALTAYLAANSPVAPPEDRIAGI